jgi:hypothetical protein
MEVIGMSNTTQGSRLPLLGGWPRNLAAALLGIGCELFFFGAFLIGWSFAMSGEHRGDQGIRDILLVVGIIGFGLLLAVMFICFFLFDIATRVEKLGGGGQTGPNGS